MPTAREKLASCVIGKHIYALGGAIGENRPGLSTNERYDTANDTWTGRRAMPTGRRELAAAVVDGKCYAIGGRDNFGAPALSVVEAYDPDTNEWTTRASMPFGRFYPAAAAIDGIIYVIGGVLGAATILDSLHAYDPVADSWTELAPMPSARGVLAATVVDGKLYVLGGTNSPNFQRFAAVEVYDPASDQWSTVADLPTGLAGLTATAANGRIYAIGGADLADAIAGVNVYDPGSDTWTAADALDGARNRHTSAVVDGEIFAIGGARRVFPPHPGIDSVEALKVGAADFVINQGLNDAWFNAATAGQGFFIIVFEDINLVFLSWFTYDTERPDASIEAILGEAGHRWLTAQGPFDGDTAMLDIVMTSGGVFNSGDPPVEFGHDYGTITVVWRDCENATLTYNIPSLGLMGSIELTRITLDNVALCEELSE